MFRPLRIVSRAEVVRRGGRGIALILTLFTVVVLVTLSTGFTILAIQESKTSRGDKDGRLASQFATAGIDAMMSYMGANVNWHRDTIGDPVTGLNPTFELAPVPLPSGALTPFPGVLFFPPGSNAPMELPLTLNNSAAPGPSTVVNPTFTWTALFNNGNLIPLDADHGATLSLVVQRAGLPGDADNQAGSLVGDTSEVYLIRATCALFPSVGAGTPLSTRTVVARIRQVSSTDNSLLIQASKFFDAPGISHAYTNVTNSAAETILNTDFANLSNIGGIPFDAQMQGQVTVLNAPATSAYQQQGQAGTIQMLGSNTDFSTSNIANGNVTRFNANVALGGGQAGIQFPELTGPTPNGLQNAVFRGGNSAAQGTQLPGNLLDENAATQYSNTTHSLQTGVLASTPMITISSNSPSNFGTTQVLASGSPAPTQPTGKDIEVAVDSNGDPIVGAPPGIAQIKITLNSPNGTDGGSVTIQKVGAYSGAPVPFNASDFPGVSFEGASNPANGTVTISVNQLEATNGGLLYVDGGNVQVNAGANQDIAGRLSIVAGASSQRPTVDATDPTNPSLVTYDGGNVTTDTVTGKSIYLDPTNSNFINAQGVAQFPFQDQNGLWHWPSYDPNALVTVAMQQAYNPSGDPNVALAMIQHDDAVTREGNLTITSSIVPQAGQQPSLGLMAQNYILLSDQTNPANNTLNVNATLQSFGHSVEWAGFLNSVDVDPTNPTAPTMPGNYYVGMASGIIGGVNNASAGIPVAPNAGLTFTSEAAAGHFNLVGTVISPFLDVEGTFNEGPPPNFIGYPNQTSKLDVHAADSPPPFLPNFNHDVFNNPANALNPISYRIESISDLDSLATH